MFRFVGPSHDHAIVDDPRWHELVRRVGMVGMPRTELSMEEHARRERLRMRPQSGDLAEMSFLVQSLDLLRVLLYELDVLRRHPGQRQ